MKGTLEAREITVKVGDFRILDKVDLVARPGTISGLIGPNGAGKTTLLRVLAGLQETVGGEVLFDGQGVEGMDRRTFARQVAYLAQGNQVHWPLTVKRLVELGRLPRLDAFHAPSAADREATDRAMVQADIVYLANRSVTTLSGGERARVMLARALAGEPRILLADEPVAALDPYHQLQVMELLKSFARQGAAIIVVLHDLTLAARFCDHLSLIDGGRPVAAGPPDLVLTERTLRETYKVEVELGSREGRRFVIPWSRIEDGK